MATRRISQLDTATTLTGAELVPVVQDGATRQATVDQVIDLVSSTGSDFTSEVAITRAVATDAALRATVGAEANPRLQLTAGGELRWGPGTAATDVTLYRPSAGVLRTGGALVVDTAVSVGASYPGSGAVRLPNNSPVNWNNAAGSGVGGQAFVNASNELVLNSATSGTTVRLQVGSSSVASFAAALATLPAAVQVGTNVASTGAVRLPSSQTIRWRNNANTGDAASITSETNDYCAIDAPSGSLLRVNGTTRVSVGGTGVTFADGTNLAVGTTNGTRIGTAANQRIGFWNAAPVAQQTGLPAAATDLASVITLANYLRSLALTLGLAAT